jgi:hypothetical protein
MGGSKRLPTNIAPRCLTRAQAAEYCGCETVEAFDGWVRKGIVPGPITGTHRWDRRAIDRALDRRSGLLSDAGPSIDEWLAENAG